jgi:hypothetical protein
MLELNCRHCLQMVVFQGVKHLTKKGKKVVDFMGENVYKYRRLAALQL